MKTYEEYNKEALYIYGIIGTPSGEYFDITTEQYLKLNNASLIKYDNKTRCFIYRDEDYGRIMNIIDTEINDNIKSFLARNYITRYRIHNDNTIEVLQDVKIIEKISHLPVKFDFVLGDFDISDCGLSTLKGCPERIEGDFICVNNNLKNLIGGPKIVNGAYNARGCRLESLKGCPQSINDDFNIGENELTELTYGPIRVDGNYYCDNCLLTTLNGCAKYITGSFDCSYNFLNDLSFGPERIYGQYDCSNNKLKSDLGAPYMAKVFKCNGNKNFKLKGSYDYKQIISDGI